MVWKISKLDLVYDLVINAVKELGIEFRENMIDQVFANMENKYSVEELEAPVDTKFAMEFSKALHDWTIVRQQYIN